MNKSAKGSCLCQTIEFEIKLPSKWVAHCHCSLCQKAHGSGYVTWVGAEDEDFRILKGAENIQWYQSSPAAQRGFCQTCGSSLFFKSIKWPGEMHCVLANFDQAIDKGPQANVNFSSHVEWMPFDTTIVTKD